MVDPRSGTVSGWVGAIVGTFKVGMGVVVGPPRFQPAKPQLILRGKHYQTLVAGNLRQVNPGKGRMFVQGKGYVLAASSTVAPSPGTGPLLILRGKSGLRIVTPGRQVTGKPRMTLKGKHLNRVTSAVSQPGKPKLILRGKTFSSGKKSLAPSAPIDHPIGPSPVQVEFLVPTEAYTDGLLVPTVERNA